VLPLKGAHLTTQDQMRSHAASYGDHRCYQLLLLLLLLLLMHTADFHENSRTGTSNQLLQRENNKHTTQMACKTAPPRNTRTNTTVPPTR
jgi:hypothetical protein